ncbi:MAG: hypothetical protein RLZZ491_706 [Pseudomonadota bacterium]|jgi:hypothetical protein
MMADGHAKDARSPNHPARASAHPYNLSKLEDI